MGCREEEAPANRITLAPLLASIGDIYKDKDERSLPDGDDSGPISMFLGSVQLGAKSHLDRLSSRSIENACALCPFRSFSKKREHLLHARIYRVEVRNYLAGTSSHSLALAKRIYEDSASMSIMSKTHKSSILRTGILKQTAQIFREDVSSDRVEELGLRRWAKVGTFFRRVLLGNRVALFLAVDIPSSAEGPFRRAGDFFYNWHLANALCRHYLQCQSIHRTRVGISSEFATPFLLPRRRETWCRLVSDVLGSGTVMRLGARMDCELGRMGEYRSPSVDGSFKEVRALLLQTPYRSKAELKRKPSR